MTPDSDSERKEWPKRTAEQRTLFASKQKCLEILPYLSKPQLDKYREVCDWTDRLIEECTGRELKQRRQLFGFGIAPAQIDYPGVQVTPLDIDKWHEDEEDMAKIKAKAQELIGEKIYLYEPDEAMVRIAIATEYPQLPILYVDVKNRLDEKGALLMARLMPRITPPMAVFFRTVLLFKATPELPADAPHGGSYLNSAIFSGDADDGGGQAKHITRELWLMSTPQAPPRTMIRTAERTVCCQELFLAYSSTQLNEFYDFLQQVAVARPLNAPARISEVNMEDGRLDEILRVFTDDVPNYESAALRLRVTIDRTAAWPESLPKERAVNERGQQLAERLYVFHHLYNSHSGERLKVEVLGSFGDDEHDGCCEEREEREECLRVKEMVLHFRSDGDNK